MSPEHRSADPIDIAMEYMEDQIMRSYASQKVEKDDKEPYIIGTGDIFRKYKQVQEVTKSEQERINNITSLKDLNFGKDGKITLK